MSAAAKLRWQQAWFGPASVGVGRCRTMNVSDEEATAARKVIKDRERRQQCRAELGIDRQIARSTSFGRVTRTAPKGTWQLFSTTGQPINACG